MKKLFDFLTPSFLQKIDQHFLLNNRLLWISKIHYVAFFAFCVLAFSGLYIGFVPSTPAELPSEALVNTVSVIVVIIGCLFWAYKQISFDIEANFGGTFKFLSQGRILLSTACLMIFFGIVYANSFLLSWKTTTIVSDQELVADINALNLGNYFFPSTEYRDNSVMTEEQFLQHHNMEKENLAEGTYNYSYFTPNFYFNKGGYDNYDVNQNLKGVFDKDELKANLKKLSESNRLELVENYIKIFRKYGGNIEKSPLEVLSFFRKVQKEGLNLETFHENPYSSQMMYSGDKHEVSNLIRDITDKKYPYNHSNDRDQFAYVFVFMMAFMGSCLLMVYHFVRIRDLIISVISLIILGIVTVFTTIFVTDILNFHSPNFFFMAGLAIYIYAFVKSLNIFKQEKYSLFSMICLILVSLASPFLVFWLGIMGKEMHLYYFSGSEISLISGMILSGVGLYLVVFLPLFHRLLLKIKALPYI